MSHEVTQLHWREVSESCFVGHHWWRSAVSLPVRRLGQIDLLKLQQVPRLQRENADLFSAKKTEQKKTRMCLRETEIAHRFLHLSGRVLGLSLQVDGWRVLHNPLDGHLNELVERVQLLAHQTFLIKVGTGGFKKTGHISQDTLTEWSGTRSTWHSIPELSKSKEIWARKNDLITIQQASCHRSGVISSSSSSYWISVDIR